MSNIVGGLGLYEISACKKKKIDRNNKKTKSND